MKLYFTEQGFFSLLGTCTANSQRRGNGWLLPLSPRPPHCARAIRSIFRWLMVLVFQSISLVWSHLCDLFRFLDILVLNIVFARRFLRAAKEVYQETFFYWDAVGTRTVEKKKYNNNNKQVNMAAEISTCIAQKLLADLLTLFIHIIRLKPEVFIFQPISFVVRE